MAGIIETIQGVRATEVAPQKQMDGIQMIKAVLGRRGINVDREMQEVEREQLAKAQGQQMLEDQAKSYAAEMRHTWEVAAKLVKDQCMIIKVDDKQTKDISVPCPECGASLVIGANCVLEFSEKYWRYAGGDARAAFFTESNGGAAGRLVCYSGPEKCQKCGKTHMVSVQPVL